MARDNVVSQYFARTAAALAGTTYVWFPMPGKGTLTAEGPQAAIFIGWSWLYETTEANADNTLDFVIDYGANTTFTALFTNGNACGLLDTGAVLTPFINAGSAASGGGAAVDQTVTQTRVPLGTTATVVRCTFVTAGTGTIPAIQIAPVFRLV